MKFFDWLFKETVEVPVLKVGDEHAKKVKELTKKIEEASKNKEILEKERLETAESEKLKDVPYKLQIHAAGDVLETEEFEPEVKRDYYYPYPRRSYSSCKKQVELDDLECTLMHLSPDRYFLHTSKQKAEVELENIKNAPGYFHKPTETYYPEKEISKIVIIKA